MPVRHKSDILFAFAILVTLLVAYVARHVLLLIYVSAMFAVVITPLVRKIQKLHIKRWHPGPGVAILLIAAAGVGFLVLFSTFALPPIYNDIQQFSKDLPSKIERVQEHMESIPILQNFNFDSLGEHTTAIAGSAAKALPTVAGAFVTFFSFLILTAYFVIDGRRAEPWLISLFPWEMRERLRSSLQRAKRRIRSWIAGQLLLMLILTVLSGLAYGLMGLKYFSVLALLTGLANIVPIIGPIISVSLACVVAAFDSWTKVVGVLAFYAAYQQLENGVLTPRIMRTMVGIPALAVIVALALGGELGGLIGAVVAVPTGAVVAVIAEEYLIKPNKEEERQIEAATEATR